MKFAAGLLRDAPVGALVCAVLLIVYDLVLVTTTLGHQFDDDAFFGPKALSRKIIRLDSDILDLVRKPTLLLAAADAANKAAITPSKRPRLISESARFRFQQFLLEPRYPSQVAAICDAL
jgi:hypothetical protein